MQLQPRSEFVFIGIGSLLIESLSISFLFATTY